MHSIHNGEIWQASRCLALEQRTAGQVCEKLHSQGYRNSAVISQTRSIWRRGSQSVVISLVDDIWDCAVDRSQDTPYLFGADTTVVTDNWINCPTVYRVARLPDSFYGIYFYQPADQDWQPNRDFTFAVNRLDFKRMRVLLNIDQYLGINHGYVNFNCEVRGQPPATARQYFIDQLIHAESNEWSQFMKLANLMPIKNYTIDHDQTYVSSWLNVIVETYSSDNIVSLSEKIFRCLVTPAPWVAWAGRYCVARLRSLGFDVLDDVVNHDYDRLLEAQHKNTAFASNAGAVITNLKKQNFAELKQRCQAAADHNQALLEQMRSSMANDFEQW